MWLKSCRQKRPGGVRHRSVRPVLESLESRLVPSSVEKVIRAFPVQDLVAPLAQVGQAIQADAGQVRLALGPDPLKTDFQLLMLNGMYMNGMVNGGYNPLPGVPAGVQFYTALQMRAAGQLAAASGAVVSDVSNGLQQFGNGINALTGGSLGGFGFDPSNIVSDALLLGLINQVMGGGGRLIGTLHFGGYIPWNTGPGIGGGLSGGGLDFGPLYAPGGYGGGFGGSGFGTGPVFNGG
jgi:hypothetical protein